MEDALQAPKIKIVARKQANEFEKNYFENKSKIKDAYPSYTIRKERERVSRHNIYEGQSATA